MKTKNATFAKTSSMISRISWSAVFAGTLTTLAILTILSLLGLGLGLTSIDPMSDQRPFAGIGTGSIIWWTLSNLIALFSGGLVAARAAGLPSNYDGAIHGFLTWALSLLLGLIMVTTALGNVIGGVGSMVSNIFSDSPSQNIADAMKSANDESQNSANMTLESVKAEMFQLIKQGENLNVLPEGTARESRQGLKEAKNTSQAVLNDLNIDRVINDFVNDVKVDLDRNGDLNVRVAGNKDFIDRVAIKEHLADNTELSEAEINGVISKWEDKIEKTVDEIEEQYAIAKAEMLEFSEEASDAAGASSIYAFIALLLGSLAAIFGGVTASPYLTVDEEHRKDMIEDRRS